MSLRCITFALVLSAVLWAGVLLVGRAAASQPASAPARAATCHEDEPCFRWPLMGNGMRGVVTLHGNPRVVDACQFRRMWEAGRIRYHVRVAGKRYRTLDWLPGDGWARRHGCQVMHED